MNNDLTNCSLIHRHLAALISAEGGGSPYASSIFLSFDIMRGFSYCLSWDNDPALEKMNHSRLKLDII